jgi:hypothetical protein
VDEKATAKSVEQKNKRYTDKHRLENKSDSLRIRGFDKSTKNKKRLTMQFAVP